VLQAAEHADLVPIVADTLVTKGSSLDQLGRSAEGLALLRAGQALAEAHGLSETLMRALGNLAAAEMPRNPRLALQVARDGLSFIRRLGSSSYRTNLLYNAAFAAMRVGEWDWAIRELDAALAEDLESSDRTETTELALGFRAYRGDDVGDMLAEVDRLVAGATDPYRVATGLLAGATVAFVAGRLADASNGWRRSGEVLPFPLLFAWRARAALWDRDLDAARENLAELAASGVHGPAIEADRSTIRAGIAALEGHGSEALGLYREALRAWRDLGLAWDEALCAIGMAILLDPGEPEVDEAVDAGRTILTRLRAQPFLERLDAATLTPVTWGTR
jgi:tetratricopeptide (TPR) repeat protein